MDSTQAGAINKAFPCKDLPIPVEFSVPSPSSSSDTAAECWLPSSLSDSDWATVSPDRREETERARQKSTRRAARFRKSSGEA